AVSFGAAAAWRWRSFSRAVAVSTASRRIRRDGMAAEPGERVRKRPLGVSPGPFASSGLSDGFFGSRQSPECPGCKGSRPGAGGRALAGGRGEAIGRLDEHLARARGARGAHGAREALRLVHQPPESGVPEHARRALERVELAVDLVPEGGPVGGLGELLDGAR